MWKAFDYEPEFKKTVLDNGVKVLTEHHPYTRSSCAGIYASLGTRDEPADIVGAAHFLEHLVFKGTKKRSAYQIVKELEAVGGDLNAFTSRENTCFHASSLREHLPLSIDVLADLVSQATLESDDVEKERQVVLQEIDMSADLLEEYIFDLYFEKVYHGHPLGRPILGTPKSLSHITRQKLYDFYKSRYQGSNLIVSVAGHVEHDRVVEQVSKLLNFKQKAHPVRRRRPEVKKFCDIIRRPSEQVHLLMGFPSTPFSSDLRFESYIVNAVLGGGMTSRLYQNIREKRGLAYAVYSYLHAFTDSGLMMLYAGTSQQHLKKVLDLIYAEVMKLKHKGVSETTLRFFKRQVMGNILLAADDVENRMNSLAINEMVFKRYRPVDEIIREIDSVTTQSIQKYLDNYLDENAMGALVLGDVDKNKTTSLLEKYVT